MFRACGEMSGRKRAEAVSVPSHFQELVAYDTVAGRPLNTVTAGVYTPVRVNVSMVPPARVEATPFAVGTNY